MTRVALVLVGYDFCLALDYAAQGRAYSALVFAGAAVAMWWVANNTGKQR